ncbi:MAG: STAS domain-containing protein [Fibrobacterota bacterium]
MDQFKFHNCLIFVFPEKVDDESCETVFSKIRSIDGSDIRKAVLDLEKIGRIDSANVGKIVKLIKNLSGVNIKTGVACPPGNVREILETTGVAEIVRIFDTRIDAVCAL